MNKTKDAYGFQFWLKWILWFAGSFVLAAIFWTVFLTRVFGQIQSREIVLTWAVAVFGSWFLLLIPFMRKKEQIWKRLNEDQEKAIDAWLFGMGIFIGLLIISEFFWSFWFLRGSRPTSSGGFDPRWIRAVFGTWLFLTLPFLVLMYRRADKIFKTAVARQTQAGPSFRTHFVEKSRRMLPETIAAKLRGVPPTLEQGHVVTAVLKDGREVPHLFVLNANEILGVYDRTELGFDASDIVGVKPVDADQLPGYEESKWLRLDGRA